jgi:hypothetical protein
MELILKTDNKNSIAKIVALAKELHVSIEQKDLPAHEKSSTEELKDRIRNFRASGPSSFGDPLEWQKETRRDRDLPFSE